MTCALVIEDIPSTGEPSPVSLDRNGDGRCGWAADLGRNPDLRGRLLTFVVRLADGSEFGRASVRVGAPVARITAPPLARGTPPPPPPPAPADAAMTVDKTAVGYDEVFTFKANVPVGTRFTFVGVRSPDGALIPGVNSVEDTTESPHVFHLLYSNLYKYRAPRNGAHVWIFEFGGKRYEFAVTLEGAPTVVPGPQPTPPAAAISTATPSATAMPRPASTPCPILSRGRLVGTVRWGDQVVSGIRLELHSGSYGDRGLIAQRTSGSDGRFVIDGADPGGGWVLQIPAQSGYVKEWYSAEGFSLSGNPFDRCNVFDLDGTFTGFSGLRREITGISLDEGAAIPSGPTTFVWARTTASMRYCVSLLNVRTGKDGSETGIFAADCPFAVHAKDVGATLQVSLPALPPGEYQLSIVGKDGASGGGGWGTRSFTVK